MFNVYKNRLSRQTGSRNLTGPKTLPTIWYTYMTLVTKYQISAINSYQQKCDEKYLERTEGRTEVKQYTPFGERGYKINKNNNKTQRGCEMNQLEMTVDESLQSKHRRPSAFSSNQKVSSWP